MERGVPLTAPARLMSYPKSNLFSPFDLRGVRFPNRIVTSPIERGQADLVLLAREALHDPHWVLHAARELEDDPGRDRWPPSWGWWLAQRERTGIEVEPGS